jgi:phenylacetate-CoA ligase
MNNWFSSNIIFPAMLRSYGENTLKKLREFDQSQWLSPQELEEYQFRKVKNMFCYAYENIPYYRRMFKTYGLNSNQIQSFSDIDRYPVLTKEDVKNYYKELIVTPRPKRFEKRSTSGTTGLALHFVKGREATSCMRAIDYRTYGWYGIKIGAKQGRFWSSALTSRELLKEKIRDILLNRQRYSVLALSESHFRRYYRAMRRFRPVYIYGYASAVFEMANFILRNKLPPVASLKVVITTSEMLFSYQKTCIEEAFKCKCVNEYGCTEVGIIAFECPDGKLHLMSDNLYVEFTKDGKSLSSGESGDILISELNSFVMPFLRYQVGDMGSYSPEQCTCGRSLTVMNSLDGRQNSFFKTPNGQLVYDNIFDFMVKSPDIRMFKVILERSNRLLIKIVPEKDDLPEETIYEFRAKLKPYTGDAMSICFQVVDNIERSPSGKRNYFESVVS